MAFINSGGIRGSFQIGNFTKQEVTSVFPFKVTLDLVEMTGKTLLQVFSDFADKLLPATIIGLGGFPQVSGTKY